MTRTVELFDTTLRDGAQWEGINFSLADKLNIARKLDSLGLTYIEGGYPGSNAKDLEFFRQAAAMVWQHATIVAFGSSRRKDIRAQDDDNLQTLIQARTRAVCIVVKSWDFHVTNVLQTTLEENLRMVGDSIAFLKQHIPNVFVDLEHFFDGLKRNRDYALQVLGTAAEAGADRLVLCDTNGGSLPEEIGAGVDAARATTSVRLGIHTHNDADLGVANTLAGVAHGATHVQGTINGYGERCGNANLCSIIPNLQLKLGYTCLPTEKLRDLTEVSRYVSEIANLSHPNALPYVGESAFAHKAGYHANAMLKDATTYQHIDPNLVGNSQRILVSELAGRSTYMLKAGQFGIDLAANPGLAKEVSEQVKFLESQGYEFEAAEASLELLMRRADPAYKPPFRVVDLVVMMQKRGDLATFSEATVKLQVDTETVHTVADGNGPVNALDAALRKALLPYFPKLCNVRLEDYKVRVLDEAAGTAAWVRVLIESTDGHRTWSTVGGSSNVIEASWRALADSIEYAVLG
ncbi:MAG TPA: citramalate synthase [Chloroflexota bacterium]|jgi:2-isopropylmalate synthase|nr:citramalate synthase [Chloroflexota bacterium]